MKQVDWMQADYWYESTGVGDDGTFDISFILYRGHLIDMVV